MSFPTHSKSDNYRPVSHEALAMHVRDAAENALAAFKQVQNSNSKTPVTDEQFADIEEIADELHGYAEWVLSGSPHPERDKVIGVLRDTAHHSRLSQYRGVANEAFWEYANRLDELRDRLIEYFESDDRLLGRFDSASSSGAVKRDTRAAG